MTSVKCEEFKSFEQQFQFFRMRHLEEKVVESKKYFTWEKTFLQFSYFAAKFDRISFSCTEKVCWGSCWIKIVIRKVVIEIDTSFSLMKWKYHPFFRRRGKTTYQTNYIRRQLLSINSLPNCHVWICSTYLPFPPRCRNSNSQYLYLSLFDSHLSIIRAERGLFTRYGGLESQRGKLNKRYWLKIRKITEIFEFRSVCGGLSLKIV